MPFEIRPYSRDVLATVLADSSGASLTTVLSGQHLEYFCNYFKELAAKTLIVERDYIDRDYLEDYSHYYVRCFNGYGRKCTRLHFFDYQITNDRLVSILETGCKDGADQLQKGYLGFVVVKPLPRTIIGRTCLKTYTEEHGRTFPVVRNYDAHLFGAQLSVNSLAFQEQDQVAAACATSCLWSIFHGTGKLFHHSIPSPIEITRAATSQMPVRTRVLPNDSLNIEQMAHGIRQVGLEPYFVNVLQDSFHFKSTLYAYIRCGLPLALISYLVDTSTTPNLVDDIQHAMAITGCKIGQCRPNPVGNSGFLSRAACLEKIYVHDDQVGPFARMEFDGKDVSVNGGHHYSLSSSWKGRDNIIGSKRAVPNILLVPLYHKIRIPFHLILGQIAEFDSIIELFRVAGLLNIKERIEWDIYLDQLKSFKNEIFNDDTISGPLKRHILVDGLPRFIWRARALSHEDSAYFEILFDATDIAQGNCCLSVIMADKDLSEAFKTILSQPTLSQQVNNSRAKAIFDLFR